MTTETTITTPATLSELQEIRTFNFRAANKQIKTLKSEITTLQTSIRRKQYYENRLIKTDAPAERITANAKRLEDDKARLDNCSKTVFKLSYMIKRQNDLEKSFNKKRYIVKQNGQWFGSYNSPTMVTNILNGSQKPTRPLNVESCNKKYNWTK